MLTCTFFGHRDCPETVRPVLKAVLPNMPPRPSGRENRLSILRTCKNRPPIFRRAVICAIGD